MALRTLLPLELRFLCAQSSRILPQSASRRNAPCGHYRHSPSSSARRSYATTSSAPSDVQASTSISLPTLPCFRARGKDIKVLYEPSEFYQTLLKGIKRAKRRIFLASLYIGKEETELIQALHTALAANPNLQLHILVDYLRSTREYPQAASSASLLASLHAKFPKQVGISLFHTPALSGMLKKVVPKRYNEGWGLWHGKVYGFDDDVIISGANLSRDYFTNRQDRYLVTRGHTSIADYLHSLLGKFQDLSYSVQGFSTSSGPRNFDIKWLSQIAAQPIIQPREYTDSAKQVLQSYISTYRKKGESSLSSPRYPTNDQAAYDTTLQPFLQMGPFGIKQETDLVVPEVLKRAQEDGGVKVDWTSGYFSLRKDYRDALLAAKGDVSIVCAAPEANGFYQSAGFSKYIPPAYTYLERLFYEEIKRQNKESAVEIREWKRSGWTYHAKGVWLSPSSSSSSTSTTDAKDENPFLTLVGSTNYGSRSAVRDLEINLLLQTSSKELRSALGKEVRGIREYAEDRVDDKLFERKERHVGWINRFAARMIADML